MAEQPEESHVLLELEESVAWIRLNRPDRLNPIGSLARRQLDAALKQVRARRRRPLCGPDRLGPRFLGRAPT